MSFSTPILLLTFNRPKLVKKQLEILKSINASNIYIHNDGPKTKTDQKLTTRIRKYCDEIDWCDKVHTFYREKNYGLRVGVSEAINWFFEHVEEGIILEDDCIPEPSFFNYASKLLDLYRNDQRIMMISGTNHQLDSSSLVGDQYFFSRNFLIWGWATWKRAWEKYDVNIEAWPEFRHNNILKHIADNNLSRLYYQINFNRIYSRKTDTWDIQWVFACLFNHGLSIMPTKNLISNQGVCGSHTSGRPTVSHFLKTFSIKANQIKKKQYIYSNYKYDKWLHQKKYHPEVRKYKFKIFVRFLLKK